MNKGLKKIRQLNNSYALFISDCSETRNRVFDDFSLKFKEFNFLSSEDILKSNSLPYADMIILDLDISDSLLNEVSSKLNQLAPTTTKIVLSSTQTEDKISRAINLQAYTFLLKPFEPENIKLATIMCINQTKRSDKIELNNGIYFDEYRDQFFKKDGSVIDFTRLEKGFLKLLIDRKNEITDYGMIKELVWKGKDMSIYTMRNIVNKIRQKTYYEIIKNHSGRGYTIDISKY